MNPEADRVARNAVWSAIGFLVPTALMLVTIPVFLHYLGKRTYGIWALVNATLGLVGILNVGLGDAATKYVAEYLEEKRLHDINLVAIASLALYGSLGGLGAWALWHGAPFIGTVLVDLPADERAIAIDAFRLAALSVVPSIATPVVLAAINGFQRYETTQRFTLLRTTSLAVFGIAVLTAGQKLRGLVLAYAAVQWLFLLAILAYLIKRCHIGLRFPANSGGILRSLFSYAGFSLLNRLGSIGFTTIDRLLVGNIIGIEAVTTYSIAQNVSSKVHMVVASLAQVLMPFFSARGARAREKAGRDTALLKSWRVTILVASALVMFGLSSSPWLVTIWIKVDYHAEVTPLLVILLVYWGISSSLVVPYFYLLARGIPSFVAFWQAVFAATFLVSIAALGESLGSLGVSLLFVCYPAFTLVLTRRALAIGGLTWREVFRGVIPVVLWLSLLCVLAIGAGLGVESLTSSAWAGLLTSLSIATLGAYLSVRASLKNGLPLSDSVRLVVERFPTTARFLLL